MLATNAEVQAIIDQESTNEMYFDSWSNKQYLRNLRTVRDHIPDEVECHKALTHLRHIDHYHQGNNVLDSIKIAKFRFSPSRWKEVNEKFKSMNISDKFLLSCSVGLGQKLMFYLYDELVKDNHPSPLEECKKFVHNKNMQIEQVEKDLNYWLKQAKNKRVLAYSMYNAGFCKEPNAYGLEIEMRLKDVSRNEPRK